MPNRLKHNGPRTNPPQHMPGRADPADPLPRRDRPTGANTSPDPANEVQDPHPADEEHPYREKRPGGANPPSDVPIGNDDIGPNPAVHDGTAPPRPHNAGSGPA